MIRRLAVIACVLIGLAGAVPAAQSDLDELMGRVLLKRDDNWKKLQQYILEERETMDVTALDGRKVYGFKREYQWFPRQGFFIKSPLTSDGVKIGEDERRRQEARWLAREQFREKRRAEIAAGKQPPDVARSEISIGPAGVDANFEAALRDTLEPGFVSAAYFMDFKFEQGQYTLVGAREVRGPRRAEGRVLPDADVHRRARTAEPPAAGTQQGNRAADEQGVARHARGSIRRTGRS